MKRYLTTTGTTLLIVVASAIAWMLILTYAWPSSAKPDVPLVYPSPPVEQVSCYANSFGFSLLPFLPVFCVEGTNTWASKTTIGELWAQGWRLVIVPAPTRDKLPSGEWQYHHTAVLERDLP